jgi:D-cysteine desulfhydrase family pyridoxal phosphate-dependent enzyme
VFSTAAFDRLPRVRLAALPTPITEARGLRDALGGGRRCPRLLLKRDDLTGLALGGYKARKLEFLIGDAIRRGATTVVTSGAVQSNHARMTAAAARTAGLAVTLVLTTREQKPVLQGNYLLDRLFGATVHLIPAGPDPRFAVAPDEEDRVREIVDDLQRNGERPYVIPVGGSSGVGALGYALGTAELREQVTAMARPPTRLYYASGSRGTQAGLELGHRLFDARYQLCGIAVSAGEEEKRQRACRIANEAAALVGSGITVRADELVTNQDHIGEGYGIPTEEGLEAIRLLAERDGVLLDPVYTAKAMAALIADVRNHEVAPDDTIMLLHTGGVPALFAHAAAFEDSLTAAASTTSLRPASLASRTPGPARARLWARSTCSDRHGNAASRR